MYGPVTCSDSAIRPSTGALAGNRHHPGCPVAQTFYAPVATLPVRVESGMVQVEDDRRG